MLPAVLIGPALVYLLIGNVEGAPGPRVSRLLPRFFGHIVTIIASPFRQTSGVMGILTGCALARVRVASVRLKFKGVSLL